MPLNSLKSCAWCGPAGEAEGAITRTLAARPAEAGAAWELGAGVAGPVMYPFVRWVLAQARAEKLARVYFLSRDGELLWKIAQAIGEEARRGISTHYLLGSRHAWYNAIFDLRNEAHRRRVLLAREPNVRGLLANVECQPETLARSLAELGFGRERWDERLSARQRARLLEDLADQPEALAFFDERRRERQNLAKRYFEQERVLDDADVAMVDVGWGGTMAECFAEMVSTFSSRPKRVVGLFFGLHRQPARPEMRAFAFGPGWWAHWATHFPSVIEMLVPGSHGQVVGYRQGEGRVEAVKHERLIAPAHLIAGLHAGTLRFVDEAERSWLGDYEWEGLLRTFVEAPSEQQLAVMRQFDFETFQRPASMDGLSLLPNLSRPRLLMRLVSPWRAVDEWPWPHGVLVCAFPQVPRYIWRMYTCKMSADRLLLSRALAFRLWIRRSVGRFIWFRRAHEPSVPVVGMGDLPDLLHRLAGKIREAGFRPDLIVYVETGARLPAEVLCRELRVGGVPAYARRVGHGLKTWLVPFLRRLPRAFTIWLRKWEEHCGIHGRTKRRVALPDAVQFSDRNILVLDDATDSGQTLRAVKDSLVARGADPARIRCAVIAATTVAGRSHADYYVTELNSVFPWSADSREQATALAAMEACRIPSP